MATGADSSIDFARARAPDGVRLYAIGDIHGCLVQLKAMHAHIHGEIARDRPADWRIIHLGDYVDRGPQSKDVIAYLIEARQRDPRHVMLRGNHEAGFVEFLKTAVPNGLFAHCGGPATARSYGVALDFSNRFALERGHAALVRALPHGHIGFLLDLDYSARFGDFFFCHAGIRPGVALERQTPEDLIWIRDEFLDYPHLHPKVIVHGHTPCDAPETLPNRVNIDTGCYRTGVLTALAIEGAEKRFIAVRA
ncbi:metallophosphoesterase family protein [Arvimicrobium flavum]|uniref:metallophosphoesterase family protein n=1 Tax=Arvimicrobium flavum TaxID=3393320 RepID=UPI00237A67E9|nr:metallophosphoesterase family protein [Mesorhizobium shangrilense]